MLFRLSVISPPLGGDSLSKVSSVLIFSGVFASINYTAVSPELPTGVDVLANFILPLPSTVSREVYWGAEGVYLLQ